MNNNKVTLLIKLISLSTDLDIVAEINVSCF